LSGFTVRSVYRHITGALCDLWAQSAHRIITLSKNCPVEGPSVETVWPSSITEVRSRLNRPFEIPPRTPCDQRSCGARYGWETVGVTFVESWV
jgi:hypothetical protein